MKKWIIGILCTLLFPYGVSAQTEQATEQSSSKKIIEHCGDRYIINVDALNPDRNMTLMDVLMTCPELVSNNGKRLIDSYELRIDNVVLPMDDETFLEAMKAIDISTIEVYVQSSVAISGGGKSNIIDIYLKPQADGTTSGKLWLEGSTRGNGKAWADVVTRSGNVTLRGYALTNLGYARGELADVDRYTSRQTVEDVHLNVDWDISDKDNLVIKFFQDFLDSKQLLHSDIISLPLTNLQPHYMLTASYTRTLNDRGATLLTEGGGEFQKNHSDDISMQDGFAYLFSEARLPCFGDKLNTLVGWEIDYFNNLVSQVDRQQMMFNDLYLQLDFTSGPWVLTLGDRFRITNYWHRTYFEGPDHSLWNNNRVENSLLASVGYKSGGHFVQGFFNRDYLTPVINFIYEGYDMDTGRRTYNTALRTNMYHCAELRYTYQQPDLVLSGSALHAWSDDSPLADERYIGIRTSLTWHKGALRLTAGADFYHWSAPDVHPVISDNRYCNYFDLRLLPTLLLDSGWRLSAKLLYNSRRELIEELPSHLYASVKVSKDFGRHCTLSADFHDLAGSGRLPSYLVGHYYDNRAITLGCTYRF